MNTQQRRLFFLTTATGSKESSFRPRGWIAVILSAALLCCSCSTLTPERLNLIAAIAGQAAQVGLQIWLSKHPDQRGLVEAILAGLGGVTSGGTVSLSDAAHILSSLPTDTLKSAEGELYIANTNRLVVWDNKVGKPHVVTDAEAYAVIRKVRSGIFMALQTPAPMPTRRVVRNAPVEAPWPAVVYVTNVSPIHTLEMSPQKTPGLPTNVVESPTPVASKHAYRRGTFVAERKEGTNWTIVGVTNGPETRVRRIR